MNDLFERIDAFTARSTRSVGAALLVECKAMITDLRPVAQDWLPIATLPFPIHLGDHAKTEHPVWLADVASGVVRTGRPTRRRRDGRIGLFGEEFYPTHWMPFTRPNPPPKPKETTP